MCTFASAPEFPRVPGFFEGKLCRIFWKKKFLEIWFVEKNIHIHSGVMRVARGGSWASGGKYFFSFIIYIIIIFSVLWFFSRMIDFVGYFFWDARCFTGSLRRGVRVFLVGWWGGLQIAPLDGRQLSLTCPNENIRSQNVFNVSFSKEPYWSRVCTPPTTLRMESVPSPNPTGGVSTPPQPYGGSRYLLTGQTRPHETLKNGVFLIFKHTP